MAICEKPYFVDGVPCACSTCDVCRIKRKRLWANRIMLESYCHGDSSFVTLTYDDDHLPEKNSLVPKDAQDWLKRLRLALAPRKIRYYLVGEYGGETWRPHYHAALFGLSAMEQSVVESTWSKGFVTLGTLTPASASYIAGYVTKKLGKKMDAALAGRHPEFQRMSLKPGIGAPAIYDMSIALQSDSGLDWVLQNSDVPHQFRESRNMKSLGRYLRQKLRKDMGYEKKGLSPLPLQAYKEEVRQLLKDNVTFTPGETRHERRMKIQQFFIDKDTQILRNVLARSKIFAQKKEI